MPLRTGPAYLWKKGADLCHRDPRRNGILPSCPELYWAEAQPDLSLLVAEVGKLACTPRSPKVLSVVLTQVYNYRHSALVGIPSRKIGTLMHQRHDIA